MSKEAFERRFGRGSMYNLNLRKDSEGDYISHDAKMAWEGWCTSYEHLLDIIGEAQQDDSGRINVLALLRKINAPA